MSTSTKRAQLKSIFGVAGGKAPYFFDRTDEHLHIWKPCSAINEEGGKYEQNPKSLVVEKKIPMEPCAEYCSLCHMKRPPVFRMKLGKEKEDWCQMYNTETRRLECYVAKSPEKVEECSTGPRVACCVSLENTDGVRDELIESYKRDVLEMWRMGKYEDVQYYLKIMVMLGCVPAAQELWKVQNRLSKRGMEDDAVKWYVVNDKKSQIGRELVEKCGIRLCLLGTPLYGPSEKMPEWEKVGRLLDGKSITYDMDRSVYNDVRYRDRALELRSLVRESGNTGVGKDMKVTDKLRNALRRKRVAPVYVRKPSMYLPKTGIVKGSKDWEKGMVLVLKSSKMQSSRMPSSRVVHGGGKYRVGRECRVKLLEEERVMLKVA